MFINLQQIVIKNLSMEQTLGVLRGKEEAYLVERIKFSLAGERTLAMLRILDSNIRGMSATHFFK